jgi:thiamine-phosphate pyrophosphorylase
MTTHQRDWPRQWLMTDERLGDRLWEAIDRLPRGNAGVVFRHYATSEAERAKLGAEIAEACLHRRLTLAVARDEQLAASVAADLLHNPSTLPSRLPFSQAVHSLAEALSARKAGADLVFVSPVFATRSHPGQRELGVDLARKLAEAAGVPAIALGGMNAQNFTLLERGGFYGWAGIDAWLGDAPRT